MKTKLASWLLILIFCVVDIKCGDQKLIEIKTVDERGDERIRVVAAQSGPSVNRNVTLDSKQPSDDEDSDEGSGDKNNEDVAHDEPIKATLENTASVSPSSTTNVVVTVTSKANDSSVAASPTKQTSNISMTVHPTPLEGLTSSSKSSKDATLTITQVFNTSRITTSLTTVPEVKAYSTSVTGPSTTLQTTIVAENKSSVTTTAPTEIVVSTARPTDHYDNSTATKPTEVTNIKPVESTFQPTRPSVDVKAHQDPTEKPRKTLFGFVTVEILIALLAGALFSVLLVAFLVYRLKKRNEGSYELSETIALRPKELDEMGTKKEVFV